MEFEKIERKLMIIQECRGGLEFLTHFFGGIRENKKKGRNFEDWVKSYEGVRGVLAHCNCLLEMEDKKEHFLTLDELKIVYEKMK